MVPKPATLSVLTLRERSGVVPSDFASMGFEDPIIGKYRRVRPKPNDAGLSEVTLL